MAQVDVGEAVAGQDGRCRVRREITADKWSVVVVYALSRGPRRHGDLIRLIGATLTRWAETNGAALLAASESPGAVREPSAAVPEPPAAVPEPETFRAG